MQVIIFSNDSGGVSVIHPAPEYADLIEAIAAKDVPQGRPWRLVDTSELPPADTRNRWLWTPEGSLNVGDAPPAPVPASITFAQLLIGLVTEGWIMEMEGDAWLNGVLPQQVTDLIATLPAEQQFAAKVRAVRPSVVLRADPLVQMMAAAVGKTPEELDQFFITYSEV